MVGVKGAESGKALMVMDKTKVLLRCEAQVQEEGEKVVLGYKVGQKINVVDEMATGGY
jgi:hypothetical protein